MAALVIVQAPPVAVLAADPAPIVSVIFAPAQVAPSQSAVLLLNFPEAAKFEGRLRVVQNDHESGSLQTEGSWSAGYVPLSPYIQGGGQLKLTFKFTDTITSGVATLELHLRPVGTTARTAIIPLGTLTIGATASNSAQPVASQPAQSTNSVTVADATRALRLAREQYPVPDDPKWNISDADGNGLVTESDAQLILDWALGLNTPKPANLSPALRLNALSPTGEEWVEICSQSQSAGRIADLTLKDTVGATHNFALAGLWLKADECLKLPNSQTKVTLNDSGDGAILATADGAIIDQTTYTGAKTGAIWQLLADDNWAWAAEANISSVITQEEDQPIASAAVSTQSETGDESVTVTTPHDAPKLTGQTVRVEGVVDEMTDTGFWVADNAGRVRVYLPPALRALKDSIEKGQLWRITGQIETYRGSPRLHVLSALDLLYLGDQSDPLKTDKKKTASSSGAGKKTASLADLLVGEAQAADGPPEELGALADLKAPTGASNSHTRSAVAASALVLSGLLWLFLYRDKI